MPRPHLDLARLHGTAPHRLPAQGIVEYGLILAFVSFVCIVGLMLLGPLIGNMFSSMTASV